MAVGPQVSLYYRLGKPRPVRGKAADWRRDERGRVALEAFAALPLGAMYQRLREYFESLKGREGVEYEQPEMLACLAELVGFVRIFGPLGFDWARTFEVQNRDADRAIDEAERLRLERAGLVVKGRIDRRGRQGWRVDFSAVGEVDLPRVSRRRSYPGLTWAERVGAEDEALPNDYLGPEPTGPLWWHQESLQAALRLADALAGGKWHVVRQALGRLPGTGTFPVRKSSQRAPVGIYWRDALLLPAAPASGWWAPFEAHPRQVDWIAAGRLGLATFLSHQLAWAQLAIGLDARERFRRHWIVGSLMEVIYLQLLEHVERRSGFGVGQCGYCHGPILRTRHEGGRGNRWHRGCAAAGRKARWRKARRGS